MYRASSIIKAIRESPSITIEEGLDLVVCPARACFVAPKECSKGRSQICEQPVRIRYRHDNHNKVAILIFIFMISETDQEGFIRKADSSLNLLLKRDIIAKSALVLA
jgi:hypothetical protein